MADSTDKDEEIGPFSAFSIGGEGFGFARLARGGVGVGTSGMVMTGGGGVGNTTGKTTIRSFNTSTNRVKHRYMQFVLDHATTGKYAWATGVLALLYRNLGVASRAQVVGLNGCPRLLQALDMVRAEERQNIVVQEVQTWLEDEKINKVEKQHLCRILEILIEDPHPMPPPPQIFRNLQYEAGEGSAARTNQGDEQHEDRVDVAHEQHQAEEGSGEATDNQADEQHEDRVDAAHD
ncbi:hypothetical protein V2J09_016481 [Rumex salicifolius]